MRRNHPRAMMKCYSIINANSDMDHSKLAMMLNAHGFVQANGRRWRREMVGRFLNG